MLTEKTRQKLLAQIRAETRQLLRATVLCKDVNTPSEIFNAMQKVSKTKQGLIKYFKYAYLLLAALGYVCAKATGDKNAGYFLIFRSIVLINKAVLTSPSLRDLLNNVNSTLNVAIDEVTSRIKEDMDNGSN